MPETNLKIKRELPLFNSLLINLFSAIKLFKTTTSLTNWDKNTVLHVFKSLCSNEITDLVGSSDNLDNIFTKLLQMKYPIETSQHFTNYLKGLKMKNFYTIKEFKFAIDEIIKRITLHKDYTRKEIQRLVDDDIINGIEISIILKFISEGISDTQTIFDRINKTEKFIISKCEVSNEILNYKNKSLSIQKAKNAVSITKYQHTTMMIVLFRKIK
ncbi:hypothetical protein DMUE_4577 [Dictyocoela muelleri]|nr:hypothetical protein DMUE_4577 [Dictyocoela muelleri]